MAVEVILPRVDMDMATGKIIKWHVKDGDTVSKDSPLFEIETDKAAMEIESPAAGIIRNILVGEGSSAPVGSAVAFIYAEGEEASAPITTPSTSTAQSVSAVEAVISPVIATTRDGLRATPLARRLARQSGIALNTVTGTGPRGRVVAADVRHATTLGIAQPKAPSSDDGIEKLYSPGSFVVQPVDAMRRTIAQRLTLSKQMVPHFYLSATCTLDNLLAARQSLNSRAPLDADGQSLWRLSINDFVVKAMGLALQRVPAANTTWAGNSILYHRTSDIGVAVAVDGGLFTPVLRAVETKPLSTISQEMKVLASKARARKLVPAEYQGGTTAISNLGMFGIEDFTAIINPPHATILAVGAGIERFVPVKGQPVLKTQMTCTLSCDHRVVDGAVGAELLRVFHSYIEDPMLMLA